MLKTFEDLKDTADTMLTYREAKPEEARLAGIVEEIASTLKRYIDLDIPALALVIALWIVQTLCFESFQYCGYLALRSATPRCGKSRLLKLVAMFSGSKVTLLPTPATIFRTNRKVLILDEVDQLQNKDKDIFGTVLAVLNCGFERGATIERCERDKAGNFRVQEFPVYGPKALAGIEALADTLSDRCFQIPMRRTGKRLPRLNLRKIQPQVEAIRAQLTLWFSQKTEEIETVYEKFPDELPQLCGFDDRFQDISEPLVLLAGLADTERGEGSTMLDTLLKGLAHCADHREPSGREQNILALLEILDEELGKREEAFFPTSDIIGFCLDHEELAWIENGRRLANFLRLLDLSATRNPTGKQRGYQITREWLDQWQASYPPQKEVEQ
jgi:putative DNA primase/helicase